MAAIFHSGIRRAATVAVALLGPASVSAEGSPGEPLTLDFLLLAGFNVVLYGAVAICWGLALRWRRRRALAGALFLAGALPFLHYAVQSFRQLDAPQRRTAELASLELQRVVPGRVRLLEANNSFDPERELRTLVATGVVEELAAPVLGRQATLYRRQESWDCIDFETSGGTQAEYRRVLLARHAFRSCVSERRGELPAAPTLQLLVDDAAPHHYAGSACRVGAFPHHTLELRRPPAGGGALVAYREATLRPGYTFPPVLVPGSTLWQCPQGAQDERQRESERMALLPFMAEALGRRSPNDFPRSGDAARVVEALHRLEPFLRSQFAHDAVLALLGQWPAAPEVDALIAEGPIAQQAMQRILPRAADLLTDPALGEHRRVLYPQLASHVPALLQACGAQRAGAELPEPCQRLARLPPPPPPQPAGQRRRR